jgi:hypothetical protein
MNDLKSKIKHVIEHDCELPILISVNKNINMDEVYDLCSEDDRENYGLENLSNPKAIKIITMFIPALGGMLHENLVTHMKGEMGGVYLEQSNELVLFGGGYAIEDSVKGMLASWLDVSPNVFKIKKLSDL